MLTDHRLFEDHGVEITDVICRQAPGRGATDEPARHAIVLVRRWCVVRRVDGTDQDSRAPCRRPGAGRR